MGRGKIKKGENEMKAKSNNRVFSMLAVIFAIFCAFGIMIASRITASAQEVPIFDIGVGDFEEPKIGELPDTELSREKMAYSITEVNWSYKTGTYFSKWDASKKFEQGQTYRVTIILETLDGYYFDIRNDSVELNSAPVSYHVLSKTKIAITKDFTTDSYLTSIYVSDLETPAFGKLPDTEAVVSSASYTATVAWKNRTTNTPHDATKPFEANTSYTAVVTINAKDGYVFKPTISELNIYINGVKNNAIHYENEKEIEAYVYFEVGYAPVEYVYIDIDTPLPGKAPDFTAEARGDGCVLDYNENGYIGGVRWLDYVTREILDADDTLVAGRVYLVSVMVGANEDYRFTADKKYVYINELIGTEEQTSNVKQRVFSRYVSIPREIPEINISNMLAPVEGNTPDYWLDVDTDGVTIESVEWTVLTVGDDGVERSILMEEGEAFVDGKSYCVTVKVKNDGSFVFATKLREDGTRYIATSAHINGKEVDVYSWRGYDENGVYEQKDEYYYAELVCWYKCESEIISSAVGRVDTPMAGNTPDYSVEMAGDIIVKAVKWGVSTTDADGNGIIATLDPNAKFEKDRTYVLTITIGTTGNTKLDYSESRGAYQFYASINGKRSDLDPVKENYVVVDPYHQANIRCWFRCNGEIINEVDVSDIVAPVAGQTPSYDITILGEGYTSNGEATGWDGKNDIYRTKNGITWYDVTNGGLDYVYENEKFIGGHTYEAWIILEVVGASRFAVDGDRVTTVKGTLNGYDAIIEAGAISDQSIYLRMRYQFTCEKVVLDEINIEIDEPVIGESPKWDKIDTEYFYSDSSLDGVDTAMLNGIAWGIYGQEHMFAPQEEVVFGENTEYLVVLYISLKEGYIIEDGERFEVYLNGLRMFETMVFTTEPARILVICTFPKTDCNCVIVPVDEVPATCTENGTKAHYACEKCDLKYKDANGDELLDEGEEWSIIYAEGHKFESITVCTEDPSCHIAECACGEIEHQDCVYTGKFIEGPSDYSKYDGTLFVCELCGNEASFSVDETKCEHIGGEWIFSESTGGTHYRVCECGKFYEEEDCNYAVTIVRFPSEYSDMRDVLLYACKDCGNEHIEPIEGEINTEDSITSDETNVTVSVPEGGSTVLPQGTTVNASPITPEDIPEGAKDMMEKELKSDVNVVGGYDITLSYKDVEIQPNDFVSVTVEIPMGTAKSENMRVLYYNNYTVEVVGTYSFDWENGLLTFETDHFSKYLIAEVVERKHTVSFNANGGTGKIQAETVLEGDYTLPSCTFTAPDGKQFKGWATSENGEIIEGGIYNLTADTEFFAIWEDIPHVHSFGSNWKTDEGEHWNECECGEKSNKSAHADANGDGKCDTCAYQMSTTPDNPDNPNNAGDPDKEKDGLSGGAIAAIVVLCVLVVGVGVILAVWFVVKKKQINQ